MKKVLLALLMAVLLDPLLVHAAKPRAPLLVSISAVQSGLASANIKSGADIKPGEVVELEITGRTLADTDELNINVELHGRVTLLSGETSWTGPARKGENKTLLITVRAPMHGNGKVSARISMSPSSSASFAAETEYIMGRSAQKKPAALPEKKKDGKGREIREYRVN